MRFLTLAALAAVSAINSAASAVDAYATNHLGQYPNVTADQLIRFDTDAPDQYITVGTIDVPGVGFGGLEFDADGNLWGYASFYHATGGAASGLYRINPKTAEAEIQGTQSNQSLQDLAYNPANDTMYGINTVQGNISTLYTVDLVTGAVNAVGQIKGFDDFNMFIGLAFDSNGNLYLHDQWSTSIYRASAFALLQPTLLYEIEYVTVGSQGLGIDWSRNNAGYHGMVAQGEFPNYLSQINPFEVDGSSYTYGTPFGKNFEDGIPPVQAGDIAIVPAGDPLPGDVDGDGIVGTDDLLLLLAAWGICEDGQDCPADFDGNGTVDTTDLLVLLAQWTSP